MLYWFKQCVFVSGRISKRVLKGSSWVGCTRLNYTMPNLSRGALTSFCLFDLLSSCSLQSSLFSLGKKNFLSHNVQYLNEWQWFLCYRLCVCGNLRGQCSWSFALSHILSTEDSTRVFCFSTSNPSWGTCCAISTNELLSRQMLKSSRWRLQTWHVFILYFLFIQHVCRRTLLTGATLRQVQSQYMDFAGVQMAVNFTIHVKHPSASFTFKTN